MMKARRTRLRQTAFHEAGHAVLAVLERIPFEHATIVAANMSLGHLMPRRWPESLNPEWNDGPRTINRMRAMIRVLYAGVIAQARAAGTSRWNKAGFAGDREQINDFAFRIAGLGDGPCEVCKNELKKAEASVHRNWAAIEALAEKLLERRTLSGRSVRSIVRRATAASGSRRSANSRVGSKASKGGLH